MTVYRVWPSTNGDVLAQDQNDYSFGMEFTLSEAAPLTGIWWWSATGAAVLPSACMIYDVNSQTIVSGTNNTSPSWSGAAGSGWVKCTYDGSVTLNAGQRYKVVVQGGSANWLSATQAYFTTGPGSAGLTAGPITVFSNATADVGQDTLLTGTGYPGTSAGNGQNFWVDVEVTTVSLPVNVVPPSGGVMGWDLYSTLQEQAALVDYYKTIRPVACPNDGTPLLEGPPQQPGILYCPMGDFRYPEDWDPNTMAGL